MKSVYQSFTGMTTSTGDSELPSASGVQISDDSSSQGYRFLEVPQHLVQSNVKREEQLQALEKQLEDNQKKLYDAEQQLKQQHEENESLMQVVSELKAKVAELEAKINSEREKYIQVLEESLRNAKGM